MAKSNFVLNSKPNKDNTYTVLLRVTHKGIRKYLATSVAVNKDQFNAKAENEKWITKHPEKVKHNDSLYDILTKARDASKKLEREGLLTAENIIHAISSPQVSSSFIDYAKQRTQEIFNMGGINNHKKYKGFCNKLDDFLTNSRGKTKDLTFAELTPALLASFQSYLSSIPNQKEPDKRLHVNTIACNLSIFRTLIKRAVEVDRLIKPDANPFMYFKFKGAKTRKDRLTKDEIIVLENLSFSEGSRHYDSRNCFLFSFYCAGIRIGDLLQLRWLNVTSEGRIQYEMGKNGKPRDIKLIRKAMDILSLYKHEKTKPSDYIFPFLDPSADYAQSITHQEKKADLLELIKTRKDTIDAKASLVRKYLKKAASVAGIDKNLTPHMARHTFARFAKDSNIDNGIVQGMLAHENSRTTDVYMGSFDTAAYDDAMDIIFQESKVCNPSVIEGMTLEEKERLLRLLQDDLKQKE